MIDTMINANMKLPKEKRRFDVCDAIEQMITEQKEVIAKNMLNDGSFSYEKIAALTGLSVEEVQALASEKSA